MKKILVIAGTMLFGFINAQALTTAGDHVFNTAVLTYTVGSDEREETSNKDDFVVDKKVDVLVSNTNGGNEPVAPGDNQAVIAFSVNNAGNSAQAYKFPIAEGTVNTAFADFDPNTDCKVFEGATDVTIVGLTIAQETTVALQVRCDIPATVVNGELNDIILTADSEESNTSGADNKLDVDVVLADGAGETDTNQDGKHSAVGTYEVTAAVIDLTKLSCVLKDLVNTDDTLAKRIPGATLVYVFDINNTGTSIATGTSISDTLVADLVGTTVANIKLVTDTNGPCNCINGTGNNVAGASSSTPTDTNGDSQGVTIATGDIAAGKHSCLSFEVNIR